MDDLEAMFYGSAAKPIERGCGKRAEGGLYAECGLSEGGSPLEEFIMCPPIPLPEGLPLSALGVQLIQDPNDPGLFHILDWVGQEHYPNPLDFLEEVRLAGMSRRLSPQLDFEKLGPGSRHFLVHAKALVEEPGGFYAPPEGVYYGAQRRNALSDPPVPHPCPRFLLAHREPAADPLCEMCAGVWWEDVEAGEPVENRTENLLVQAQWELARKAGPAAGVVDQIAREITVPELAQDREPDSRIVKRSMPSFTYYARRAPESVQPAYRPAIFASFPITRLVAVQGGNHDENRAKAERVQPGLPVVSVEA